MSILDYKTGLQPTQSPVHCPGAWGTFALYNTVNLKPFIVSLQGQCYKIFDHFFFLKDLTWAPYEQAKTVSRKFFVFVKIFPKNVCPHSYNDYADMFQHSQRLRRHHVSVVKDYADTHEIILLWKK